MVGSYFPRRDNAIGDVGGDLFPQSTLPPRRRKKNPKEERPGPVPRLMVNALFIGQKLILIAAPHRSKLPLLSLGSLGVVMQEDIEISVIGSSQDEKQLWIYTRPIHILRTYERKCGIKYRLQRFPLKRLSYAIQFNVALNP